MPIYYYCLCVTTCHRDGSKFFFIQRTQNPSLGSDGTPFTYLGTGEKLRAKVKQYGMGSLSCEVLRLDPLYENVKRELDKILNEKTLADPLCLNMPLPEKNKRISEALIGKSKSELHKENIAQSMAGNENAMGHIVTEEHKEVIANANRKLKWYHCKSTGEELQLEQDEDVLTGFELGRLPKALHSKFKKDSKHELTDQERAMMIKD